MEPYYRLDDYTEENGRTYVSLSRHPVAKQTAKGVWLNVYGYKTHRKFVLINSHRKWASPTLEEEKQQFKRRKEAIIRWSNWRIGQAERALDALTDNEIQGV